MHALCTVIKCTWNPPTCKCLILGTIPCLLEALRFIADCNLWFYIFNDTNLSNIHCYYSYIRSSAYLISYLIQHYLRSNWWATFATKVKMRGKNAIYWRSRHTGTQTWCRVIVGASGQVSHWCHKKSQPALQSTAVQPDTICHIMTCCSYFFLIIFFLINFIQKYVQKS